MDKMTRSSSSNRPRVGSRRFSSSFFTSNSSANDHSNPYLSLDLDEEIHHFNFRQNKSIYHHEILEGEIFWNLYSAPPNESRRPTKTQPYEDEEIEKEQRLSSWKYLFFKTIPKLFWSFISFYRIDLLFRSRKYSSIEDQQFSRYLLEERKKFGFRLCCLNLLALGLIIAINIFRAYTDRDNIVSYRFDILMIMYCIMWCSFTFLICLYFMFLNLLPRGIFAYLEIDIYDTWEMIGNTILYSKLFIIITRLINGFFEEPYCYSYYEMQSGSKIMPYIVYQTILDMFQASVLALFPFHWKLIFSFSSIQFIEIIFRIYTCLSFAEQVPHRVNLAHGVSITVLMYFVVMISFLAFHSQMRLFSTFKITQEQQKISQQKMKIINLLCRDVKLATMRHQQLMKGFEQTFPIEPPQPPQQSPADRSKGNTSSTSTPNNPLLEEIQTYLMNYKDHSFVINNSVNDIVFLVKVGEGRFSFSYSDVFHIRQAIWANIQIISSFRDKEHFHFEDLFRSPVNIPDFYVKSHFLCFRILLSFSMNIIYAMWEYSYFKEKGKESIGLERIKEEKDKIMMNCQKISRNLMKSKKLHEIHRRKSTEFTSLHMKFQFVDQEKYSFVQRIEDSNNENLKSWCLACQNIVNRYQGKFHVSPTSVEFTIPAEIEEEKEEDPEEDIHNNNVNNPDKQGSIRYREFYSKRKGTITSLDENQKKVVEEEDSSEELLINFLQKESCIYLTDQTMESLVLDTICKLGGNENSIDIYKNQESLTAISKYFIVFIQSIEDFHTLKKAGYKGETILLSEHLLYLGDISQIGIGHGVLLPSNTEEIHQLKSFLFNFIRLFHESGRYYFNVFENEKQQTRTNRHQQQQQEEEKDALSQKVLFPYAMEELRKAKEQYHPFPIFAIPYEIFLRTETFLKWRNSAVLEKGLQRTFHLDVVLPLVLLFQFGLWSINGCTNYAFSLFIFFGVTCWIRDWIDKYVLRPLRIPLGAYYRVWCLGVLITSILSFVDDAFIITFHPFTITARRVTYSDSSEFLSDKGHRGYALSLLLINIPSYTRLFAELVPWPLSWVILTILILRSLYIYIGYLAQYMDFFRILLGSIFIVLYFIWFSVILYSNTYDLRDEFLSMFQLILSEDFYDRCLQFTEELVITRLIELQGIEEEILKKMKQLLTTKSILLTKAQYSLMIHLQCNYLKIQRIDFIMKVQEKSYFIQSLESFLLPMKATLLFPFLSSICSSFVYENHSFSGLLDFDLLNKNKNNLHNHNNHHNSNSNNNNNDNQKQSFLSSIKIYVKIHPNISLVRINRELLLTTIVDVCSLSIQNIKKTIQDDSRQDLINHQILLILKPADTEKILRFNEVRELEIIALDTSYLEYSAKDLPKLLKLRNFHKGKQEQQEADQRETTAWLPFLSSSLKGSKYGSQAMTMAKNESLKKKKQLRIDQLLQSFSPAERQQLLQERDKINREYDEDSSHSLQIMKTEFHSLSDRFSAYFRFSSQSEYGFLLNHFQYHAYYKVSLPYMLCTSSYDLELAMQKERAQIRQIFPPSMKYLIQYHILYNQKKLREKEAMKEKDKDKDKSKNTDNAPETTEDLSIPVSNVRALLQGYSSPSWTSKTPMNMSFTSSSSATSAGAASSTRKSKQGTLWKGGGGEGRGHIGSVSMYHLYKSDSYYASPQIMSLFASKDWDCQCHAYPSPSMTPQEYPDKSQFMESDIIVLEYAPRCHSSTSSGSDRLHQQHPFLDLKNFIHYIRAVGCQALIVIVYASYVKEQEDHVAYCLQHPNDYSDAMSADLHVKLPWKSFHIDDILIAWEQKFFQKLIQL